ncbi:hypothetical protein HJG54_33955 [Leptolyngbya sp. NK1-12]|uniref:Uncharacterized protein n=1 Tax=Leptolyngbya sp. NK1-12 TaxID=2547451 RepID=A0AA96WMI9_9CYAN|nr:hypothetical protein HJG54_33955 [Leptolyngbya sp. NK1-12]
MQLKRAIWLIGILAWIFSFSDRGIAAFKDGYLSLTEGLVLLAIFVLFLSWVSLKPQPQPQPQKVAPPKLPFSFYPAQNHLAAAQARMDELQPYHLISQSYLLPYPYLAQIYHLLNLKHLETIHSFSLNNLKVVKVSSLEKTEQGGIVTFQTMLDSPLNILRIWRETIAEVKLTLHTPYTVELGIPVYGDKIIIVLFNAIPLSGTEHQFCVDIYSNLNWYKPALKPILHFASLLTLIEDLPYLEALTRKVQHLSQLDRVQLDKYLDKQLDKLDKTINHEMWLFNRFIGLYGANLWGGLELAEATT